MVSLPRNTSSSCESLTDSLEKRVAEILPSLERLACHHAGSSSVEINSHPSKGSYNLVYAMSFPDGRKWAARIPEPSCTDVRQMESMIGTMRLISARTTIPLPIIYAYDTSSNNELGLPYIFMSWIDGIPLVKLWNKEDALDDEGRKRILERVAHFMSEFRTLEFNQIGQLEFPQPGVHDVYTIGPMREIQNGGVVYERGPFDSVHGYISELSTELLVTSIPSMRLYFAILRILATFLPNTRYDGPPFVLSPPDFESQNVMVNPTTLEVTGFIDWDGVCVGPRENGFARYPTWITRDWDPVMYRWEQQQLEAKDPSGDSSFGWYKEESPTALQAHRDFYHSRYAAIDPINGEITRHSHIFEGLLIALTSPEIGSEISQLLMKYAFGSWVTIGLLKDGLEEGLWERTLPGTPHVKKKYVAQDASDEA